MKNESFPFSLRCGMTFYCAFEKLFFAKSGWSCLAVSEVALKTPINICLPYLADLPGGWRLQQNPHTSTLSIKQYAVIDGVLSTPELFMRRLWCVATSTKTLVREWTPSRKSFPP